AADVGHGADRTDLVRGPARVRERRPPRLPREARGGRLGRDGRLPRRPPPPLTSSDASRAGTADTPATSAPDRFRRRPARRPIADTATLSQRLSRGRDGYRFRGRAAVRRCAMRDNGRVTDAQPQPTLYDLVGGEETFRRLVARFYAGVRDDPVLRPLYP